MFFTIVALFFGAVQFAFTHAWIVAPALALVWIACLVADIRPGAASARLRTVAAATRRRSGNTRTRTASAVHRPQAQRTSS